MLPSSRPLARAHRAVIATVALAAALAAPVGPVAATDIDLGVELTLGLPCVEVDTWAGGDVTATQRRAGKVIKTVTVKPRTATGTVCLKPFKSGDQLTIKRGSASRKITVPAATLSVDLASDTVSGTLPAATSQIGLLIQDFTAGLYAGTSLTSTVSVTGGTFSTSLSGVLDLARGDRVAATWSNGADTWKVVRETGTAVVRVGDAAVAGTGRIPSTMTVTLRTSRGKLRGTAKARVQESPSASAGFFNATFRKNGRRVAAVGGNRVTATQLSGTFTIPRGAPAIDVAANRVTASCDAGSDWLVLNDGTKVAGGRTVSGAISVSPVNPYGPLALGTRVTVACQAPSGFGFIREVPVE